MKKSFRASCLPQSGEFFAQRYCCICASFVYFLPTVWLQEEAVEEVGCPEEAFEGAGALH